MAMYFGLLNRKKKKKKKNAKQRQVMKSRRNPFDSIQVNEPSSQEVVVAG